MYSLIVTLNNQSTITININSGKNYLVLYFVLSSLALKWDSKILMYMYVAVQSTTKDEHFKNERIIFIIPKGNNMNLQSQSWIQ